MIRKFEGFEPKIDPTAFIADDALVIGKVVIGAESGIWYKTIVRGDVCGIEIGERSNIQDACMLHCDDGGKLTVGNGVTVGHRVILHGCSIGDGTLIGMGAIVLEGAVIGKNCVIGAGAVVTQGSVIPDGSVAMGIPAAVKRQADANAILSIQANAERYVRLKERHRNGGL